MADRSDVPTVPVQQGVLRVGEGAGDRQSRSAHLRGRTILHGVQPLLVHHCGHLHHRPLLLLVHTVLHSAQPLRRHRRVRRLRHHRHDPPRTETRRPQLRKAPAGGRLSLFPRPDPGQRRIDRVLRRGGHRGARGHHPPRGRHRHQGKDHRRREGRRFLHHVVPVFHPDFARVGRRPAVLLRGDPIGGGQPERRRVQSHTERSERHRESVRTIERVFGRGRSVESVHGGHKGGRRGTDVGGRTSEVAPERDGGGGGGGGSGSGGAAVGRDRPALGG
mmetsp:Transcript_19322/g.56400  ORF Transcript_19322/g.56400 Transcript_19322/m.56400 type:complete len:276 (-) Transcript_19322:905-1732(-)